MKRTLLVILSTNFMINSMETGDNKKENNLQEFCNACFTEQESTMVQQSSTEHHLPICDQEVITKSLNKKYSLYKSKCKEHATHRNMYYLTTDQEIIDKWRDYYDWGNHTAINNDGTYVITKREQDYWLRKITYKPDGPPSSIHTVTPIQAIFFPCFFLNKDILIAYGSETTNERYQQTLYAWNIHESFGQQRYYSKKNIYTPAKILPKLAYRVWDEDKVLVADCKECSLEVSLSLWDVRAQTDMLLAKFNIDRQDITLPLIAGISARKRYFACALNHRLFLKDSWHDKSTIRQSSGCITYFYFGKTKEEDPFTEDNFIKYSIAGSNQERIWSFKSNSQASQ